MMHKLKSIGKLLTIIRVSKAKLLGILIDETLTWEDHINHIIIPKPLKIFEPLDHAR